MNSTPDVLGSDVSQLGLRERPVELFLAVDRAVDLRLRKAHEVKVRCDVDLDHKLLSGSDLDVCLCIMHVLLVEVVHVPVLEVPVLTSISNYRDFDPSTLNHVCGGVEVSKELFECVWSYAIRGSEGYLRDIYRA
jgi:hypothetical protein